MAELVFVEGLIAKEPPGAAPDYVKVKLSIKREEMIKWLESQDGEWINAEVKEGRSGKWYVAVDDWKPDQGQRRQSRPQAAPPAPPRRRASPPPTDSFADDDIPF